MGTWEAGDPAVGQRLGSYEVARQLARGGMATVFEVVDTRSGATQALKLLLPLAHADEAKTRFRREFRALSRLQHPNVLQVFEWGLLGDRPWYSMELVPGRDLRDEVELWASLPPNDHFARAQAVLVQVARALAFIHDRGLIHRDITPGNIRVRPDGVVKVMDFGVVKDLGSEVTMVGEVVGTVAYISPEQIAGDEIDARADLYSLGAVLYLMLTGKRPFQAKTLQGYLEKHLHETPKPPRELDPNVPPHLEQICMRLLQKDPSMRYASATHLLHVLGDLQADEAEGRWPPRAVGRQMLRARIREVLDDLGAGRPGAAILVTGSAGQGKSRLLDMAETYARRRGLLVARGGCREDGRPFGPFASIWRDLQPDAAPSVLRSILGGEDDVVVRERYPVIAAFKELVLERAPCVILIDDLEAANAATLELLEYLIRNTLALSREKVAIVIGAEGEADTPAVRQIVGAGPVERVELGPLSVAEIEELVLSVLPNSPAAAALARRLHAESNGAPAFVADMLRALLDEGLIVKEGRRWKLTLDEAEITRSRLPMPPSLRAALQARLEPLPSDAIEIARTLAISRRRLPFDTLVLTTGLDEERVMLAIDRLVDAGIVDEKRAQGSATSEDGDDVELAHHRLRDVLLEPLDEADKAARHQRMGEVLERQHRHRHNAIVEELAWHFEQAGLAPKAYAYLTRTATRYLHRSLWEEALAWLDRALVLEPKARPLMLLDEADEKRAELLLQRGTALHHRGSGKEARSDVEAALALAREVKNPRLQARILGELGQQQRNIGQNEEAEASLREALKKAQEVGDDALKPMPMYALGGIVWGRGDLAEAERLWRETLATAQRVGDEPAQGFGFNGLGILALCKGDSAEARRLLEQSAELFERLGMLAPLAIARVNLVDVYLATGVLRKALMLADRTVAQSREVHHPYGIAVGLAYRAGVLLQIGRIEDAWESAKESLRIVRELGTVEDEVVSLAVLVRIELIRGHPDAANELLVALVPLLDDYDSEGIAPQVLAMHAQALAMRGRNEEARAVLHEAEHIDRPQWPHVQVRADLAAGVAWRLLGDREAARKVLQRALTTGEANGYRMIQLQAHHELWQVADDETQKARHGRVAGALARSLAASLARDDSKKLLATAWGGNSIEA